MLPKFHPLHTCRVINIEADYSDQKLMTLVVSDEKQYLGWLNFPEELTTIDLKDFKGTLFPDIFDSRFLINEPYYNELRKRIINPGQNLFDFVRMRGKVPLADFLKHFVMLTSLAFDEVEAVTKLEIAKGLNFEFLKQKGGDFISLAKPRKDHEDKKIFLSSITTELLANSDRIDYLIRHAQTKGNFRELLLRNVLKKYVPKRFEIATGFIEGCSRQCDIIIYDSLNYAPLFKEDDLVVVPPKSVRAVIEVKTTLDATTLKSSLELIDEIAGNRNYPAPFFKGIFAFKSPINDIRSLAKTVREFYQREDPVLKRPSEISHLYQAIDSIAVLGSHYLETDLLDMHRQDRTIRPRLFSIITDQAKVNLAGSSFFSHLFFFLDVEGRAKKDNNNYFRILEHNKLFRMEEELTNKDWIPSFHFLNEHDGTPAGILQRITDVLHWQQGFISTSELEEKYFGRIQQGFSADHYYKS